MSRQRAVAGARSPAVGVHLHLGSADVDHRLDCQHQSRLQPWTVPGLAKIGNLGLLVECRPDSVPDELPDYREPVRCNVALDRVTNIRQPRTGRDDRHRFLQGFAGNRQQPAGLLTDRTDLAGVSDFRDRRRRGF